MLSSTRVQADKPVSAVDFVYTHPQASEGAQYGDGPFESLHQVCVCALRIVHVPFARV
jgi:hypothetical protein